MNEGKDTDSEVDEEMQAALAGDSSDEERMVRGSAIFLSQQRTFQDALHSGPGTVSGTSTRRYLPPGRPIELYWQYHAAARHNGEKVGSFTSFLRVFHLVFERAGWLKFRKRKGDHSKCTACEGYQNELKVAREINVREQILQAVHIIMT